MGLISIIDVFTLELSAHYCDNQCFIKDISLFFQF